MLYSKAHFMSDPLMPSYNLEGNLVMMSRVRVIEARSPRLSKIYILINAKSFTFSSVHSLEKRIHTKNNTSRGEFMIKGMELG